MTTHSQAKQDLFAQFVGAQLGGRRFIDIGCSEPGFFSNARLLLENGWTGVGVDSVNVASSWVAYQGMRFIQGDACAVDWKNIIDAEITYLSADVDGATLDAMRNLFRHRVFPLCATVEHDVYRLGSDNREQLRQLMLENGYEFVLSDVKSNGCEFEDWWIKTGLSENDKLAIRAFCQELHPPTAYL